MAELHDQGACAALDLPLRVGSASLALIEAAPMLSIAPYRDGERRVADALAERIGGGLPETGNSRALDGGGRIFWTGAGLWFLRGPAAADEALSGALIDHAALTDQGAAWTGLRLDGAAAAEVLARLAPVDLEGLPAGTTLRTGLRHVMCALVVLADGYEIWVMRSFSLAAAHDIETAMRHVAGAAEIRNSS